MFRINMNKIFNLDKRIKWDSWVDNLIIGLGVMLLLALLIILLLQIASYFIEEPKPKQQSKIIYDTLKLGDEANEVIIDERTNCKYILFNNKTLVPLYNEKGQVEGCGQYE